MFQFRGHFSGKNGFTYLQSIVLSDGCSEKLITWNVLSVQFMMVRDRLNPWFSVHTMKINSQTFPSIILSTGITLPLKVFCTHFIPNAWEFNWVAEFLLYSLAGKIWNLISRCLLSDFYQTMEWILIQTMLDNLDTKTVVTLHSNRVAWNLVDSPWKVASGQKACKASVGKWLRAFKRC